ncbi:MAG TPA: tetratricopeptide repeat protein [Planctomycetaceae bacterium]|jgi:tetratricopeptide (TPR) repeat protein
MAAWPVADREFRINRARAALQSRHGEEALAWLSPLIASHPKSGEFHFQLARAYRRIGRLGQVEPCLLRARELDYPVAALQREQILALAQAGRMTDAEPALRGLLLNPGEDGADICEAFASGYFLNFQIIPGLKILEAWEKDYPGDAQPHVFRGKYYENLSSWQLASAEYRRALELSPESTATRVRLAQVLVELNEYAAAHKEFDRCLGQSPDDVEALVGRARCLRVAGRDDAARRDLLHSLKLDPGSAEALGVLGELELQAGDSSAAIQRLRESIARDSTSIEFRNALAGALQSAGQTQAAQEQFKYVDAARSAELKIHAAMRLLLKHDDDLNSDEELRIRFEIGSLTLRYGDPADGVAWLESVLRLDHDYAPAHQLLFEHFSSLGDDALAERHRIQALRPEGKPHGS